MRVLVIGSGGREHALVDRLSKSPSVQEIYIAPGNGGTVGHNIPITADDIPALVQFARGKNIDLVVPGPELPLTVGIADAMQAIGIPCFGPDKWASSLEGSKAFAKGIMRACGVPTAKYAQFDNLGDAELYIKKVGAPIVIKADGLAAGKGVVVAETLPEALDAAADLFKIADKLVIEEKLVGEEVSLLCICDGQNYLPLPSAQDHKAAYDNDQGPNTGGMGAYSPAPVLPDDELDKVAQLVIRPVLTELAKRGHPFKGVLYAGLMMTKNGPMVLEYNVRFGDPECQVILPRLKSDLAEILMAAATGRLSGIKLALDERSAVGVVLAAGNYPDDYPRGLPITGISDITDAEVMVYQAGTQLKPEGLVSNGGRVLGVIALGDSLVEAQKRAYDSLKKIGMPLGRYRKDIAEKGLRRLQKQSAKASAD